MIPTNYRYDASFLSPGIDIAQQTVGRGTLRDEMRTYSDIALGREEKYPLALKDVSRGKGIRCPYCEESKGGH